METDAVGETSGDVEAEAVVDTLAKTLTKAKYKKPLNTLCNVEAEAQVDTMVDKVTES